MSTYAPTSPSKPLAERSPNTFSPSKTQITQSKEKMSNDAYSMPENRQHANSQATVQAPLYHSPSDNILSPTSKKLSEIKGKRFASGKPQSLFAKTVRKEGLKSQEKLLEAIDGQSKA